ncbi:cell division protein FtsQ/DivIB [Gammaproteobacteria bacterium]|nr:cell division protein FtsQ/DivIB [Gammaproteobacteria bacterium]
MRNFIFRLTKRYNSKAYIITAVILLSFYSLPYLLKNSDIILNKSMELAQLDIKLKNVKILGIENTKPTEVINIVSGLKETSLSNIDLHEISTQINNIDWIKKSELRKVYPSTLVVKVYEHNPIAIWFNNGNKFLVDDESEIIKELNPNNFKNLKVIAGLNALEDIPEIISMIRNYPEFEKKIKSLLRVGDRRWTVRLHNGITIHLPEKNVANAIEEIEQLDSKHALLSRYVDIIDMRLPDRIDIMPSGVAMSRSKNII